MSELVNTVDALMDLDPLSLTSDNIDSIIAYHRKNRANAAAGIKPKREQGPKIDISALLQGMTGGGEASAPKATNVRRR